MPKRKTPKAVAQAEIVADDSMPATPGDRLPYFHAKRTVLDHEVREATHRREFGRVARVMQDYGEFLERHPHADGTL